VPMVEPVLPLLVLYLFTQQDSVKLSSLTTVDAWRAAFYYRSDSHISTLNDFQQYSVSPFPTLRESVSRREIEVWN